jgi:hypothetical protein
MYQSFQFFVKTSGCKRRVLAPGFVKRCKERCIARSNGGCNERLLNLSLHLSSLVVLWILENLTVEQLYLFLLFQSFKWFGLGDSLVECSEICNLIGDGDDGP